jgi:hypothetical protein
MFLPQSKVAEPLVQNALHGSFGFDAPSGMIEEIFVETDTRVPMPPRSVKNNLDGQDIILKNRVPGKSRRPAMCFFTHTWCILKISPCIERPLPDPFGTLATDARDKWDFALRKSVLTSGKVLKLPATSYLYGNNCFDF